MKHINGREDVIKKFAEKIHELTSKNFYYNNPKIEILRKASFLIDELLEDKEMRYIFEQSVSHMQDSKIKINVFSVIRNVLAHFSFYEDWDEIYLNEEIVNWNNPKGRCIKNFFSEDNEGKEISYDVYFKLAYSQDKYKQTIKVKIPSLKKGFYMKDFICLQDLYYTFFLVDHLLEKLGIETQIYSPPSI